jgi:hypothetical protein
MPGVICTDRKKGLIPSTCVLVSSEGVSLRSRGPILSPWLGNKAGYGIVLSYRPASQCRLHGGVVRQTNAIAGFIPQSEVKNTTSAQYFVAKYLVLDWR